MSEAPKKQSLTDRLKRMMVDTEKKKMDLMAKSESDKENNSSLSMNITSRQNKSAPPGAIHNSTSDLMASMHAAQNLNSTANDLPLVQCVEDRSRDMERRQAMRHRSQTSERRQIHQIDPIIEERSQSEATPSRSSSMNRSQDVPKIYRHSQSCSNISLNPDIITVKGKSYLKLKVIGRGGSSKVIEAVDDETKNVVAIKIVDLDGESEEVRSAYLNEIDLLRSLQPSKHVITMYDSELVDDTLYVVLERGDTDLSTHIKTRAQKIDTAFIRYFWKEMLYCVKVIHDRNIVHQDLKPANFLMVKGNLKLIDFGIASRIETNKTSVHKTFQMGTLNYMSPEALKVQEQETRSDKGAGTFKLTHKSDVWSLGCILYTLVYGKNPFVQYKTHHMKTAAITSDDFEIEFPQLDDENLEDTLRRCLTRNVESRASVNELLEHPYCSELKTNDKLDISTAEELLKHTPRTAFRKLQAMCEQKSSTRPPRSKSQGQSTRNVEKLRLEFEQ